MLNERNRETQVWRKMETTDDINGDSNDGGVFWDGFNRVDNAVSECPLLNTRNRN